MSHSLQEVKSKFIEIQNNEKEVFMFPYLQQLFYKMGYNDVQITHGRDEYGKDLVFKEYDSKLMIEKYTAVVVKNRNATMNDFVLGGELFTQIQLSFNHPYKNEKGNEFSINNVIVIINGSVTFNAKEVLSKDVQPSLLANIEIWNYQKLSQYVHQHIPDIFLSQIDPTINKFLKHQEEFFLSLNMKRDFYQGINVKDINDIYVNARTTIKKYQETKIKYSAYAKKSDSKPIEEQDDSISIAKSNKDYIIHGIPTSGKTLLLHRIGYNSIFIGKSKPIVPFYIELGKVSDFKIFDILQTVEEQYSAITFGDKLNLEEYSKICIMLDGFDEILNEENKNALIDKINSLKTKFETEKIKTPLQVILTTREISFFEITDTLKDFEKIELLPFDVGQAFKLVKKLIPNDNTKAEKFISAIKDHQLSNSLTRTPMALSLMAILYKDEAIDLDELPANITELYNKFTDYYLNRWDTEKGISLQYKYEEAKHILAFIAKELHKRGTIYFAYDDLKAFLSKLKEEYDYEDLKNIDEFLLALKSRVGLVFFDDSTNQFLFNHLAFQEYFASISHDDSNEDELIDCFFNDWWSNVIIFYCGKQPKRDIFLKKINKQLIPLNVEQYINYLILMSKSLQACYLISNSSRKKIIENMIFSFGKCYDEIISYDKTHGKGLLFTLSTLDFIIQFRDFFKKLFSSKHINFDIVKSIGEEILQGNPTQHSDITLYSIAHFLSYNSHSPKYLEKFIQLPDLDARWQRIVFVDIENLHNRKGLNEKLLRKLKQKQVKNKEYILKQFKSPAYKYLLPIIKD